MLVLRFANDAVGWRGDRKLNQWLDEDGRLLGEAFAVADCYQIDWAGLGTFFFSATSLEVRVSPAPGTPRSTIAQTFHRVLQPLVLQAQGWQVLHASACLTHSGVVAFCGKSGSGKSTLAFAMQQKGWQQIADDALILKLEGSSAAALALPFLPRLRPASLSALEYFGAATTPPNPSEREYPLVAMFVLRQATKRRLRLSRLSRANAFRALLTHAHCFDQNDPAHTRRLTQTYLEVAARVPVFTLDYTPDFRFLSELCETIVAQAMSIEGGSTDALIDSLASEVAPIEPTNHPCTACIDDHQDVG